MPVISLPRTLNNSGQIKCNGYLVAGQLTRQSFMMNSTSGFTKFAYPNNDLSFSPSPTTLFPDNDVFRDHRSLWNDTDGRFLENPVPGQWTTWRIQLQITKQAGFLSSTTVRLTNPISGFTIDKTIVLAKELAVINDEVIFPTIADDFSIGKGYEIGVLNVDDNGIGFELISVARHSSQTNAGFAMTSQPRFTCDSTWREISTGWTAGKPYTLVVTEQRSTVEFAESAIIPDDTTSTFKVGTDGRLDVFFNGQPVWIRNIVSGSSIDECVIQVFEAH